MFEKNLYYFISNKTKKNRPVFIFTGLKNRPISEAVFLKKINRILILDRFKKALILVKKKEIKKYIKLWKKLKKNNKSLVENGINHFLLIINHI